MKVHLIDGTYELFRHYFALPSRPAKDGTEIAAVRGVVGSILSLLEGGATHIGVATDHVIESFRNDLWPGYKTGAGVAPDLLAQFPILEDALVALGVVVWPMEDYEADDALASAASVTAKSAEQVLICTPDKDLAQCVVDRHVIQLDRRSGRVMDEDGVIAKFGVRPSSIPDYLALVGDSADGFPGLPGWGAKSAAVVLTRYQHLEAVPHDSADWDVAVRSADRLAITLAEQEDLAKLFKNLATLRTSLPILSSAEELRWARQQAEFPKIAELLGTPSYVDRAETLASKRG